MTVFVGDDWAEAHHDVHLMNDAGDRLAGSDCRRASMASLRCTRLVAEHADDPSEVIIGIETERGMWVQALIGAGYQVYAINPLSVSRYRDRHNVAGAKSDPGDAKLLADLVRTDRHNHRPVAGDTDAVAGLKVLARAHQNLIWDRTRHTNRLRNDLREFYPAALVAFDDLAHPDAVAVLAKAPTLTLPDSSASRRSAQRCVEVAVNATSTAEPARSEPALRSPQLAAPPRSLPRSRPPPEPWSRSSPASTTPSPNSRPSSHRRFEQHPDADIYLSLPGLGVVLGARVLGEFGDDPERYADAKSRRNYAGTSPLTVASGTQTCRARPPRPQPAPLRRHRPMGLLQPPDQPRLPRLLRRPTSRRRPPPPSPPSPRQPTRRLPPRLPQNPHPLQRTHRLGPPTTQRSPIAA